MKATSARQVNRYLRTLGYREEIYRVSEGGPYYAWSGGDSAWWSGTYVPRVGDLSMERWIEERNHRAAEATWGR